MQEVVARLGRAFDYYAGVGDVDRAVAVVTQPLPPQPGQRTGVAELIPRALALVPPDFHQSGNLLSLHGRVMSMVEGDYEGAMEAFEKALAIARREGDAALELRTLSHATHADALQLRWQESLEKGQRVIELAQGVDDLRSEMPARH